MEGIRSLLFVPAEEKCLEKIGRVNADAYIIDLEDSIDEMHKDEVLQRTVEFLDSNAKDNIFVRINKSRYKKELNILGRFNNIGIMLPKFQLPDDYADMGSILEGRNVLALIESPQALINANAIAAISWVSAVAFGAEDFTVSTNMLNSYEILSVPKSMLAIAAKANHKKVYDTPCFHLYDDDIFHAELQQAADLGYEGKLAIHPKQIDEINRVFGLMDKEYMKHVIEEYDVSGKAVCEIDGVVYEKFHVNRFKRMLLSDGNG